MNSIYATLHSRERAYSRSVYSPSTWTTDDQDQAYRVARQNQLDDPEWRYQVREIISPDYPPIYVVAVYDDLNDWVGDL